MFEHHPQLNLQLDTAKIHAAFKHIDYLVSQLQNKVSRILVESGIKYFSRPSHESLMRLLIPYELKIYVDFADVCCLFENRSDLIRSAIKKENSRSESPTIKKEELQEGNFYRKRQEHHISGEHKNKLMNNGRAKHETFQNSKNKYIQIIEDTLSDQKKAYKINQKKLFQQIMLEKICQWTKREVLKGMTLTRNDVYKKIVQIGLKNNIKLNEKWLKNFISKYPQIRNYLTHGNSNSIRKKSQCTSNIKYENVKAEEKKENFEGMSVRSEQMEYFFNNLDYGFEQYGMNPSEWAQLTQNNIELYTQHQQGSQIK